jgi:hypothetical protein
VFRNIVQPTPQYEQTEGVVFSVGAVAYFESDFISAPVGQTTAQRPQKMQVDSVSGFSKSTAIETSLPLWAKPSAETPITSSQTRTQRAQ